jgi:hypothetical protein
LSSTGTRGGKSAFGPLGSFHGLVPSAPRPQKSVHKISFALLKPSHIHQHGAARNETKSEHKHTTKNTINAATIIIYPVATIGIARRNGAALHLGVWGGTDTYPDVT